MALDQKALQKKRAKREERRKQARHATTGLSGALIVAREWGIAARAPIADVFVPSSLVE